MNVPEAHRKIEALLNDSEFLRRLHDPTIDLPKAIAAELFKVSYESVTDDQQHFVSHFVSEVRT